MENIEELETLEALPIKDIPIKVKKPRTQKQIDAFAKVQATRQENRDLRKTAKDSLDKNNKELLDKKIIAKAIALKKKQIRDEKILSIVEDEQEEEKPLPIKKAPVKRATVKKVVKVKEPVPQSDSDSPFSDDSDSDDDYRPPKKSIFKFL